ncbi:MAG: DUF2141 domain-containing protein [Flavisolibacter sp.]|nr:DUF2141 domain-containing protein [Flavisolibacter sp.]
MTISNFENNKGVCQACIFNSAPGFEKMEALRCFTSGVQDKSAQIQFDELPDGTYSIFVFHDENKNSKMDKNFLGIPKEGYGASGNKLPFATAPKFEENKFQLNKQSSISIAIRLRNI